MPTAAHALDKKIPTGEVQPGQYVLLFLQDHPKELAQVSDFDTMFWGLVLKNEPTRSAADEPVWHLTLMLENGTSVVHRRINGWTYVAVDQPTEFSDQRIEARIAESTRLIEVEEAIITRLKAVQAAVHTS